MSTEKLAAELSAIASAMDIAGDAPEDIEAIYAASRRLVAQDDQLSDILGYCQSVTLSGDEYPSARPYARGSSDTASDIASIIKGEPAGGIE